MLFWKADKTNKKRVIEMEDAKINWNEISIEKLKKAVSKILGIKEEDIVFAGIDFIFIDKNKKFQTKINVHIPDYNTKDYE